MTVYVDDMRLKAKVGRYSGYWSHLFADTHEELEEFARKLKLKPEWIQYPGTKNEHYDVIDTKRALAIKLGAEKVSWRKTAEIMEAKKL